MAVNIPTITELKDRLKNDIEGKLNIVVPSFGKSFLLTWIGVIAAKLKIFYLKLYFVQKNTLPDTADPEAIGGTLERWGRLKLERNPFAATSGLYSIEITGVIGATINSGQRFKSDDDSSNPGKLFVLDNDFVLSATTETIQVRSLETGVDARLVVGDNLSTVSPIVNVDRASSVVSEDVIPLDAESDEDYRQKTLEAFVLEAQGGAVGDYRLWSSDVQGVRRVYPNAKSGASGEMELFVEATIADSTDQNGTPTQAILDEVESVTELDPDITKPIDERGRRPIGVFSTDFLPVLPLPVDVVISGFVGLTPEIETLIQDSVTAFLYDTRPFIAGADKLEDKTDVLTINSLSFNIVSVIPKGTYFSGLSMDIDGLNVTTFQFIGGYIPYLNSITYQ